jgi:hypothetical protein
MLSQKREQNAKRCDFRFMADQTVNKFVIRNSIKELQAKRTFSTLEELAEAVNEDLYAEGFAVGPEEKAKIANLVQEEGYTGRFAIDDILGRKIKNKKWLPLVSIVSAACLFLLTTAVAAVVEHYVQRPLDGDRKTPPPLTAVFQVPETVDAQLLFKVQLTNLTDRPLRNVVLFASAGGVARQLSVDAIEGGQSRTVDGTLDLPKTAEPEIDFVAYVISGDFSLSSQPTRVAREPRFVAMLDSAEISAPQSAKGRPPGAVAIGSAAPAPSRGSSLEGSSLGRENTRSTVVPASNLPPVTEKPTTFRTVPSSPLTSDKEIARLAERGDAVSRQLLEAYAASGHQEARRLLGQPES